MTQGNISGNKKHKTPKISIKFLVLVTFLDKLGPLNLRERDKMWRVTLSVTLSQCF